MRLIIFGASGSVGHLLTEFALAEGHQVTAVCRDPSRLNPKHPSLHVVAGDVTDAAFVAQAVRGQDMVFSTLGRGIRPTPNLSSIAACNIMQAMNDQGIRRLMFLSLWGVLGEHASHPRAVIQLWGLRRAFADVFRDSRRALDEIQKYNGEWMAVRPLAFTNGRRTGKYRVVLEGLPQGGTRISRADVADFMLRQAGSNQYVHKIPAIAY